MGKQKLGSADAAASNRTPKASSVGTEQQPSNPAPADLQAHRAIADIKIGKRHRKDLGDIAGLAEIIQRVGLLHPIPIRSDGTLIAGRRRLAACTSLGWKEVPVNVVPIDDIVLGEYAENAYRKDFLPSEVDAIRRVIEPIEKAAAKSRQGKRSDLVENFHNVEGGKTRDKVAAFAGLSGRTLDKIKAVVEAAEEEPERFGHLTEQLDRPHGVNKTYHLLRRAQDEQRILNIAPKAGTFRTLVLDPPWPFEDAQNGDGAPYALMSREQLLALPVASWAEDDAHLYLWTTNRNLPLSVECMAAWGFTHTSVLTWVKPGLGLGSYFRGTTEHVLFGLRGKLRLRSTTIPTHFEAPTNGHSVKPERFYEIVREASYLPAGEAFQRKARDGFVNLYGNQAEAA